MMRPVHRDLDVLGVVSGFDVTAADTNGTQEGRGEEKGKRKREQGEQSTVSEQQETSLDDAPDLRFGIFDGVIMGIV